jgi:hypothetical protein
MTSDHRGLFIDFNADSFMGGDPSQLMSHALCGIKSSDPKKCRQYVTAVNKYLIEHKVYARVIGLEKQAEKRGFTVTVQKGYQKVDQDLLRACLYTESTTNYRDRPAWSPKLHQSSMMVAYWKIKLTAPQTTQTCSNKLANLLIHIDWGESPPLAANLIDICTKLRSAQNKIRTIRKQASKHRSNFLQQRAAAEALAGNQEEAKILRRLERAEATKACYQMLRKGITKIEVQDENGDTQMITDPEDMVDRILKRNQRHFFQATDTPFTTEPLTELLGKCGETHTGKALTTGAEKPALGANAHFPETQLMLDALQPFQPPANPVSIEINTDDYKKFFK